MALSHCIQENPMRRRTGPYLLLMSFLAMAIAGGGVASVFGAAAQEATPAASGTPSASAPLQVALTDVSGTEAGSATFEETSNGVVTLSVTVQGLEPGEHGIHVHESGVCDPSGEQPFSSAGGHYNPTGADHGAQDDPDAHAGDLGNITIADDGTGTLEVETDHFTLSEGPTSLFDMDGSSLLIHDMPDDLMTDPSGASGGRLVCGIVAEPIAAPGAPTPAEVTGANMPPLQVDFSEDMLSQLQAPEGFEISVFASGIAGPRMMLVVSEGVVLVSQPDDNSVLALRDTDGDGVVDESEPVASNMPLVHGMALHEGLLYLAGENTIWTTEVEENGAFGTVEVLVDDLPDGDQHGRHTLAIGPDGMLYVSVGSSCNACGETNEENATIMRMNLDGTERTIFASGLRNTLGWGWHPDSGELWGMDHGSDWRGDDQPPEELNNIVEGANYGWPYCYGDRQVDPYFSQTPPGSTSAQYCALTEAPVLTYQAHSAPIGMVYYYTAGQFPDEYQGDAFVAMRGSWNRTEPVGYKVVRVDFEDGQPVAFDDFITGWLLEEENSHFGRLAGLVVLPDGSMLISDDTNGVIYRVTYSE